MILDFWNTNLNPVTMFTRELDAKPYKSRVAKSPYKHTSTELLGNSDYIHTKKAIELTGLGSKKIKMKMTDLNIDYVIYKSQYSGIFYRAEDIAKILEHPEPTKEDMSKWISSKDLRKELGLDTMQLWTLSDKMKWTKKKLGGNVNHFLRSEVLK